MIKERLEQVQERIERSCRLAGRSPGEVHLVVVTKGHPAEPVRAAVEAGARWLGENYYDEAVAKMDQLQDLAGIHWHMIGHIQSRKAAGVAGHFDFVHSVDSQKLAERLNRSAAEHGRSMPVLLEINVSGEETKFGFSTLQDTDLENLYTVCRVMAGLSNLRLRGLMTMAPYGEDPEAARPTFRRLREIRDLVRRNVASLDLPELSMGMSGDFEVAIQEGATIVRIGEAILGPRIKQNQTI